jgi:ubiquinone/menaquinone biosynthesis C-methylase UbiE
MNKKIFEQEIKDWDKNVNFYMNENLMPFQEMIRREIYDFYELSENDKVLEAGGGAIKINPNTVIMDFSPKMVEFAKSINPPDRKIILGSVHQIPFADQTFDAVVVNGTFHHLKAQDLFEESVKEFHRVLKPKGKICVFDRAYNLIPNFFFYLRKPIKKIYSPKSQCSTRNETFFLESDIEEILKQGFRIEKRKYLVPLPLQLLIISTNVFQYLGGKKLAQKSQKFLKPLGRVLEKYLAFKPFCAEQCLILRKI